ncbi:MAG: hypothetical protein IT441_02530 [Phycisphaeraceae bacterium]|nr:hypothetical protein [Phycisphaeraceae bacterium]
MTTNTHVFPNDLRNCDPDSAVLPEAEQAGAPPCSADEEVGDDVGAVEEYGDGVVTLAADVTPGGASVVIRAKNSGGVEVAVVSLTAWAVRHIDALCKLYEAHSALFTLYDDLGAAGEDRGEVAAISDRMEELVHDLKSVVCQQL